MSLRDSEDYRQFQKYKKALAAQRSTLQEGGVAKGETVRDQEQCGYDAYEQHLLAKLVQELHKI